MSERKDFYAKNHTELVANTPAAIGPAGPVDIAQVVVTATITGTLSIYDGQSTSGKLIYAATTPALGVVALLNVRCTNGCWVVPGTAGTCSVFWG